MADAATTYPTGDVVATDYVIDTTVDSVSDIADRQTDEISQVVSDGNAQVTTLIEERTYEQSQKLDGLADEVAKATADELERREQASEDYILLADGATRDAYTNVRIEDTQWQYIHDSYALRNTCAVLSLVMLCALLGSNLASRFLDRWR